MSETSELYEAMRAESQWRRHNNLQSSTEILKSKQIPFETKNNGVHLIVADRYDFWPSTGLYIDRENQKRGRGVFNLIMELQHG